MAKASVVTVSYREFTLVMSEEEARWLKELLEHPINFAVSEKETDTKLRDDICTALKESK